MIYGKPLLEIMAKETPHLKAQVDGFLCREDCRRCQIDKTLGILSRFGNDLQAVLQTIREAEAELAGIKDGGRVKPDRNVRQKVSTKLSSAGNTLHASMAYARCLDVLEDESIIGKLTTPTRRVAL